jgi:hypothetical protein
VALDTGDGASFREGVRITVAAGAVEVDGNVAADAADGPDEGEGDVAHEATSRTDRTSGAANRNTDVPPAPETYEQSPCFGGSHRSDG